MTVYVWGTFPDDYSGEDTDWHGWTTDLEQARLLLHGRLERYVAGQIMTLGDDGTVDIDTVRMEPDPYKGPLARARISIRSRDDGMVTVHRHGIDCMKPRPNEPLDEWYLWRCVATSFSPDGEYWPHTDDPFACICGTWQDIEGEPNAVAEMAAKYPHNTDH